MLCLKKLQALIQAEEAAKKRKQLTELRHEFDLDVLLNQTEMARSRFLLST